MDFDGYTIALLLLRPDAPELSEVDEDALQDAHMNYLAGLHDSGELLAAGPVLGPPDRAVRGFAIYVCDVAHAQDLADNDPAVIAGRYRHELHPWLLPANLITFTPGRLPRSMAEASK